MHAALVGLQAMTVSLRQCLLSTSALCTNALDLYSINSDDANYWRIGGVGAHFVANSPPLPFPLT